MRDASIEGKVGANRVHSLCSTRVVGDPAFLVLRCSPFVHLVGLTRTRHFVHVVFLLDEPCTSIKMTPTKLHTRQSGNIVSPTSVGSAWEGSTA